VRDFALRLGWRVGPGFFGVEPSLLSFSEWSAVKVAHPLLPTWVADMLVGSQRESPSAPAVAVRNAHPNRVTLTVTLGCLTWCSAGSASNRSNRCNWWLRRRGPRVCLALCLWLVACRRILWTRGLLVGGPSSRTPSSATGPALAPSKVLTVLGIQFRSGTCRRVHGHCVRSPMMRSVGDVRVGQAFLSWRLNIPASILF